MTRDSWKDNPAGPKYIVGVTNFVYRQPLPKFNSRAAMYRCLLQNLRLIPDPVIWSMVVPAMRKWCAAPPKTISSSGAARTGAGGEAGPGQTTLDLEMAAKAEEKELQQIRKRTLENAKEVSRVHTPAAVQVVIFWAEWSHRWTLQSGAADTLYEEGRRAQLGLRDLAVDAGRPI